MTAGKHRKYLTAEIACIASILLVIGVLYHTSGSEQGSVAATRVGRAAAEASHVQTGASRKLADKACMHWSDVQLPALNPKHKGAVADIKRMTADYAHVSAFIQSCEFKSNQLSSNTKRTKGIAIPSAGHTMFAHTWVVVTILREALGCKLPIEVIYNGQDEYDEELALRMEVSPHLYSTL